MELTESLQDYLFEIYIVSINDKVVRLKDVAKRRNVKLPSVVNAIKELAQMGLVTHEYYGYIELTEAGVDEATKLFERHKTLYKFLHEILGINEDLSEKDAHKIEHDLSKETILKLTKFIEFIESSRKVQGNDFIEQFRKFAITGEIQKFKSEGGKKVEVKLSKLKVGEKGHIVRVESGIGNLKARLLDMGAVPGTEVKVERIAPLGDPIDILIKGYHLSLRKDEAEKIIVEVEK
jgi:DtxR family Mn-dependent transcriptional regulator